MLNLKDIGKLDDILNEKGTKLSIKHEPFVIVIYIILGV